MAKPKSSHGSFQQLLLFAFLLITALLVGVALRSVFQYDALVTQSRDAAARALTLSGAAQSLAERSAAMERARCGIAALGHQYVVLEHGAQGNAHQQRGDQQEREQQQLLERAMRRFQARHQAGLSADWPAGGAVDSAVGTSPRSV